MTEWMVEHWLLEGMLTICGGVILAFILIRLAKFLDRD